jgi:hypothetical protein
MDVKRGDRLSIVYGALARSETVGAGMATAISRRDRPSTMEIGTTALCLRTVIVAWLWSMNLPWSLPREQSARFQERFDKVRQFDNLFETGLLIKPLGSRSQVLHQLLARLSGKQFGCKQIQQAILRLFLGHESLQCCKRPLRYLVTRFAKWLRPRSGCYLRPNDGRTEPHV